MPAFIVLTDADDGTPLFIRADEVRGVAVAPGASERPVGLAGPSRPARPRLTLVYAPGRTYRVTEPPEDVLDRLRAAYAATAPGPVYAAPAPPVPAAPAPAVVAAAVDDWVGKS